jgi:hypothetical protein
MRRKIEVLAIMMLTAAPIVAQNPPAPPAPARGGLAGERSAQTLLARSAELDLTDAQVTKLAQIARRSETRRRALRATMDSGRTRFSQPGDSIARRQFGQRMQDNMTKERDQARVDLRDAITVLTPDQQAKAWEMNAARGARAGRMGAMRGRRDGGMGGAMRGRAPGMGGRPGMSGRPGGMRRERDDMPRQRARDFGPDGRVPPDMPRRPRPE